MYTAYSRREDVVGTTLNVLSLMNLTLTTSLYYFSPAYCKFLYYWRKWNLSSHCYLVSFHHQWVLLSHLIINYCVNFLASKLLTPTCCNLELHFALKFSARVTSERVRIDLCNGANPVKCLESMSLLINKIIYHYNYNF